MYDNLGIETAWKRYATILVSDAGGRLKPEAAPPSDCLQHMLRVLKVIDSQVPSLRKRQLIESFKAGQRTGMYVGIRSQTADYPLADPLAADPDVAMKLAAIPTRLDTIESGLHECLINWGYVICDTGLRAHLQQDAPPGRAPYPANSISRPN